ncbi:EAL domain-containing protein [Rhizobium sp. NFR03]|uniref:bifunctional diguanylate cyclase/phosphodiesterase n=1 Tax=Rhizobium sp. NFR03 TaxID=1566263 RepID=UPI0008B9DFD1|nr:EAL domain-containing protein [Rhizobium sp. NFR03]SER98755.1 diguanylate cyclase (GGDEF) domain-containing protein [Rhizobium sp. NFR03]
MAGIGDAVRARASILVRFTRSSLIPSLVATLILLAAGHVYQTQNSANFQASLRSDVQSTLRLVEAQIQANIDRNTIALAGLANDIALDGDIPPAHFAALATKIMERNPGIRRISLAPGGVISRVMPSMEHARMAGTRLDRFYSQRTALQRAQAHGNAAIGSLLVLPDGSTGFDVYLPVFSSPHGQPVLWGFVEAVIDESAVYLGADLMAKTGGGAVATGRNTTITLSIRDVSNRAEIGDAFFGKNSTFHADAVLQEVSLPGGTWQLAGAPLGGFDQPPGNQQEIAWTIMACAMIVIVPIVLTFGLMGERRRAISALDRRNREFLAMSRRLNLALECSSFGVWEIDLETRLRTWDDRMYSLHGLAPRSGAPGQMAWKTNIHPDDLPHAEEVLNNTVMFLEPYQTDYRVVLPTGTRHIRHIGSVNMGLDHRKTVTGLSWDITEDVRLTNAMMEAKALAEAQTAELAAAKDRIEHNALHDPLTGLGNRRMLDAALAALLDREPGRATDVALLHLDLDRFKQINDTLGHAAGDAMLVHASRVLKTEAGADDLVARIGGDEFVVLVPNPVAGQLEALSDRIIARMRQPVDHEGFSCRFGVSVGIAVGSSTDADLGRLMVNADIALYRAKERGRNRYEFFSEALQSEIVNSKRIADEILEGIERGEFTAWYQPQFDAETLQLCGVEALIRWNHPRDGVLTPDRFLSIAEDLNVVAALDQIVMERALIDLMHWTAAGIRIPRVSVNVSARRLRDETLLASLAGLAFAPGQLCFELVEAIFLDGDDEIITANIAGIVALGIDIELDDFGTGHTSIVSLLKIKPKRLKIDRQLVSPIPHAPREQALVRAIIEIGRSLGIGTVAEGVETLEHAEMLAVLGCDILQGYAFSRPLPADGLADLAAGKWQLAS